MKLYKSLFPITGVASLFLVLSAFAQTPFPTSETKYDGASSSRPFVATLPYKILINGAETEGNLLGKPRSFDFGGDIPFLNVYTGAPDPYLLQAWDTTTDSHVDLDYKTIGQNGFPGHITKSGDKLVIKTLNTDGMVGGTGRTFLVSYPVPPRTHVRWEMNVAFGDADNEWLLLAPKTQPMLFWELKSDAAYLPALSAEVDTDPGNPQKIIINFFALEYYTDNDGKEQIRLKLVRSVPNIDRHTPVSITIEAFLDERLTEAGGKGVVRYTVNNVQYQDVIRPTLVSRNPNNKPHTIQIGTYSYNDKGGRVSYPRTTSWRTARLFVYPLGY